jgi:dephospho-CoA kinase
VVKVAITGGLGAGKSTVLRAFKKFGAAVISCDDIVHRELAVNRVLMGQVRRVFGDEVFRRGRFDRLCLARKAFADAKALGALNRMVHPWVRLRLKEFFTRNGNARIVAAEVPLLFETDFHTLFNVTVGVATDPKVQEARGRARWGNRWNKRRSRMRWQLAPLDKTRRCDVVIDNTHSRAQTLAQVKRVMEARSWKS